MIAPRVPQVTQNQMVLCSLQPRAHVRGHGGVSGGLVEVWGLRGGWGSGGGGGADRRLPELELQPRPNERKFLEVRRGDQLLQPHVERLHDLLLPSVHVGALVVAVDIEELPAFRRRVHEQIVGVHADLDHALHDRPTSAAPV